MIEHKPTGPIDRVTYAFSRVTIWSSALIVIIMLYEVVMRYIFFSPTLWVNEMSLWVGGILYVTAGLYAMQQRSHIRIYVLHEMAPMWLRRIFDLVSMLCASLFVAAVIWGGFGEAITKFERWEAFGTAWDPPIPATDKPLVLITLFFLMLQGMSNLLRDWPAVAWVRKCFDVLAGVSVIGLCFWALPGVVSPTNPEMAVPGIWRGVIALILLVTVAYALYGLIRDFNTTPEVFEDQRDPAQEFDLPPDVLSQRSTST